MELDESARYALGALFSLSLHANELKAGAQAIHRSQGAWGRHDQTVVVTDDGDNEELQNTMAFLWDAFWGYDLVQRDGLLDRVFTKLGIPETSWQGLKWLPEVAAQSGYGTLVHQYRTILDANLKALPPPTVPTEPSAQLGSRGSSSNLAAAVAEDDEDLARDMKRGQFLSRLNPTQAPPSNSKAAQPQQKKEAALDGWEEEWDPFGAGEDPKAGDSAAAADATADVLQRQLHVSPSAGVSHQPVQQPSGGSISPVAFQCAADLLEACLASVSQPQLEDIVKADKASGRVQKVSSAIQRRGAEKAPNVRWYDSRGREALQLVAVWLQIPWEKIQIYECLLAQQNQVQPTDAPGRKELSLKEKRMRALKIGAAAAGGGAILAVTGGLAAPALAAVAGTVLTTVGGSAAAAAAVTSAVGSTAGAAAVIAGFGAGGAHVVGGKMARRVGDVKEFGFRIIPDDQNYQSSFSMNLPEAGETGSSGDHPASQKEESSSSSSWSSWRPWSTTPKPTPVPLLPIPVAPKTPENPRLSKIIAVAGSVAAPDDFIDLWRGLSSADSERFCLVWETAELMALNTSIVNMLLSQAYSTAGRYVIEKFVIHGLVGAVSMPLTVLNVAGVIDSCWAVVMNRAARAGELLAHLLMSGAHGDCPVTLIGNSMGARLIYYCLLELSRCQCKGIVQNAILLGAPVDVIQERWVMARSVVSGRLVNGFSRKDWVLALGFRARQGTFRPAAGLGEIKLPGVEDIDLSDIVNGHGDYVRKMGAVLSRLGLAHES